MDLSLEQHLRNLYMSARRAPMTADEHEQINRSANAIQAALKELSETKAGKEEAQNESVEPDKNE